MTRLIEINGRPIGEGCPTYIVAEMSANHNGSFDEAVKIIRAASEAGADAIKLQTYTPDTVTIDCDEEVFKIRGTPWDGRTLHELYADASTPWEWQPRLKAIAEELGLDFFSTPFDQTAVDFLQEIGVAAYKVASFEAIDLMLLRAIAKTGRPIIMSTGMMTLAEMDESVRTVREAGGKQLVLLKCTSAYPSLPEEMNLRTIPHLAEAFDVPVGLSDHTLELVVPTVAVSLGACVVEKHLTLSRSVPSPDAAFSLEPEEFAQMVSAVRSAEKALGSVSYGPIGRERESQVFRRSLFVVMDLAEGDLFSVDNVRSIRPGYGLHPRHLNQVIGRCASGDIERGTPLSWDLVGGPSFG